MYDKKKECECSLLCVLVLMEFFYHFFFCFFFVCYGVFSGERVESYISMVGTKVGVFPVCSARRCAGVLAL